MPMKNLHNYLILVLLLLLAGFARSEESEETSAPVQSKQDLIKYLREMKDSSPTTSTVAIDPDEFKKRFSRQERALQELEEEIDDSKLSAAVKTIFIKLGQQASLYRSDLPPNFALTGEPQLLRLLVSLDDEQVIKMLNAFEKTWYRDDDYLNVFSRAFTNMEAHRTSLSRHYERLEKIRLVVESHADTIKKHRTTTSCNDSLTTPTTRVDK